MNCDINAEAPRPRPLSAGIWTLFSWLRREERSFSNESISSAGSDRTAVSFAFLEPLNYKAATEPIVLPPLSPPTDSYRKRVRDRNFRRQRERNITLHRKYGLFKGENIDRFDAFSLPPAHRNSSTTGEKAERGRRAVSESFQRRAPYVPGKRRAPLPPSFTTSLPRNFSRKRPAPQPPNNLAQIAVERINLRLESMNPKSEGDKYSILNKNVSIDNKTEKSIKQEKIKVEKNFLKQIFDNKKRNSVIETSCIKLLPNISELDKQAAKIIENKKLKMLEVDASNLTNDKGILSEGKVWSCSVCHRKYNAYTSSCPYCVPNHNTAIESDKNNLKIIPNITTNIYTQTDKDLRNAASTSKLCENEEKKKLKEMLKEMKDSLPKRPKHNLLTNESPTLRIGSSSSTHKIKPESSEISLKSEILKTESDTKKQGLDVADNRILDIKITNGNIDQPSSSAISTSYLFQTKISKVQCKNTDQNCNVSEFNSPIGAHVGKMNMNKTEIENSQALVSTQRNNIPISKTETTLCKNDSTDKVITQEKVDNLQLKDAFLKKQIEVNKTKKISNCQLPNNSLTSNTENIKPELLHVKNTQVSKPLQFNSLSFGNKTTLNMRTEKDNNVTKQSLINNNSSNNAGDNISCTKKLLSDQSILNNNQINQVQAMNVKTTNTNINNSHNISNLHTPLKISSLLNPVYRPIQSYVLSSESSKNGTDIKTYNALQQTTVSLNQKLTPIKEISEINEKESEEKRLKSLSSSNQAKDYSTNTSVCKVLGVTPSSSRDTENRSPPKMDHHSRRRELVNQLEKSIAKGDEQAAADAAVKLAKLRLSCSVLSFSSQIIGSTPETPKITPKPFELPKPIENDSDINKKSEESNINKITRKNSLENNHNGIALDKNKEKKEIKSSTSKIEEEKSKRLRDKMIVSQSDIKSEPSTSKYDNLINGTISIQVWVEDKEATRGPISLRIPREATMLQLRREAEITLGLDSRLQRWIVGRTLCLDVNTPLISLAGSDLSAPFYLCLVESETKQESTCSTEANEQKLKKDDTAKLTNNNSGEVYNELMKLEQQAIVPNSEAFECGVCMDVCEPGRGAVLRDCIHTFCRDCLSDVVRHCEDPIVSCPAMGCPGVLQEREIRVLLTHEEYERWLARGLATAECGTRNAFHCRTRDCTGWALCETGVRKFPCPVCKCNNCVPCQAIHEGETCEEYQAKLRSAVAAAQTNDTDEGTRALLNSLIRRGEALECPECRAIITKKWGCDWVKCSACKTEICWVTRGRRWGPGGRGDTSAGCRCGVDGKRCHPSCGYCH